MSLARRALAALLIAASLAWAAPTSRNNARLKAYLAKNPAADADRDGVLTLDEARAHFRTARARQQGQKPAAKGPLSFPKGNGLRIVSTGHSWVGPALRTLPSIARAAGLDGHRQRAHTSGGGSGSANSIWLAETGQSKRPKSVLHPAIATGKWDVMTWGAYYGDLPLHYTQWIDLCLKANPDMVFYIQDGWLAIHRQYKTEDEVILDVLLARQKATNGRFKTLLDALNAKYPGKIRLIPVGDSLCEMLKLYYAGNLPGIEGLSKHLCGKEYTIWRDGGHLGKLMDWWEGYVYYAALYKKSPALIDARFPPTEYNAELDKRMRECAWRAVVSNPCSGVTDGNGNGIGDEIEAEK